MKKILKFLKKKEAKKQNKIKLIIVFIITCIIGLSLTLIYKKQYTSKSDLPITNIEIIEVGDTELMVTFQSEEAVYAYLMYQVEENLDLPIMPTTNLEKKTDHAFIFPKQYRTNLTAIINGNSYQIDNETE